MKGYILSTDGYPESTFWDYIATSEETIRQAVVKLFKAEDLCLMTCDYEQELNIKIDMEEKRIEIKYLAWDGDPGNETLEFAEIEILT